MNAQTDVTAPHENGGDVLPGRVNSSYLQSSRLISALQNPDLYEHPVDSFQVIETHISWVLLTGPYAYKIKKPVQFGFLDFSSLSLRQQYCEEELRLNLRFAPQVYETVIGVTGSIDQPRLGGKGEVIEYMVKMRQFSQQNLLIHLAEKNSLLPSHIDEMAEVIARHHRLATHASVNMVYGTVKSISKWVNENFIQVWPLLKDRKLIDRFVELQDWSERELEKCWRYIGVRKRNGFVRECHGDLHLGNMVLIDNQLTLFDCIEFNPELRWIDVISEVAFVVMDLQQHCSPELARRFINRYLQQTGDYAGLKMLRYYLVYRALVRAKVAALRTQQAFISTDEASEIWKEVGGYMELAQHYIHSCQPIIILMHGLSGSGKSTLASKLAEGLGAFQIRSDIERKRLHGYTALDNTESDQDQGIYTTDATQKTYARLGELAETVVNAGYKVIVDASFLRYGQRVKFRHLAKILGVPCVIVDCTAPDNMLKERVVKRAQLENDPSEATVRVLEKQFANREPLKHKECGFTVSVDTSKSVNTEALVRRILKRASCSELAH